MVMKKAKEQQYDDRVEGLIQAGFDNIMNHFESKDVEKMVESGVLVPTNDSIPVWLGNL